MKYSIFSEWSEEKKNKFNKTQWQADAGFSIFNNFHFFRNCITYKLFCLVSILLYADQIFDLHYLD